MVNRRSYYSSIGTRNTSLVRILQNTIFNSWNNYNLHFSFWDVAIQKTSHKPYGKSPSARFTQIEIYYISYYYNEKSSWLQSIKVNSYFCTDFQSTYISHFNL